jgi:hypothetical protein
VLVVVTTAALVAPCEQTSIHENELISVLIILYMEENEKVVERVARE